MLMTVRICFCKVVLYTPANPSWYNGRYRHAENSISPPGRVVSDEIQAFWPLEDNQMNGEIAELLDGVQTVIPYDANDAETV